MDIIIVVLGTLYSGYDAATNMISTKVTYHYIYTGMYFPFPQQQLQIHSAHIYVCNVLLKQHAMPRNRLSDFLVFEIDKAVSSERIAL